jgi:16S rRNA (cytidine1402-2'-O)-methyltransferase
MEPLSVLFTVLFMSAITSAYTEALAVAKLVAGGQTYSQSTLYVVATPIGNLADISLRSLYLLNLADTIACEDTRHTGQMLHAYGLHKPLMALHEHNELEAAQSVITKLQAGERVAYVSDAGTPAVSDPGSRLVAAVASAGLRIVPLPGASSVTAVLSAAGCVNTAGFVFAGFLPPKGAERATALKALEANDRAVVVLEAPHRIEALFKELASFGERRVTVGRELTKQFESIATMTTSELPAWLAAKADNARGEFALVVHPQAILDKASSSAIEWTMSTSVTELLTRLLQELPLKTAVQVAVDLSGLPKNALYEQALLLKNGHD